MLLEGRSMEEVPEIQEPFYMDIVNIKSATDADAYIEKLNDRRTKLNKFKASLGTAKGLPVKLKEELVYKNILGSYARNTIHNLEVLYNLIRDNSFFVPTGDLYTLIKKLKADTTDNFYMWDKVKETRELLNNLNKEVTKLITPEKLENAAFKQLVRMLNPENLIYRELKILESDDNDLIVHDDIVDVTKSAVDVELLKIDTTIRHIDKLKFKKGLNNMTDVMVAIEVDNLLADLKVTEELEKYYEQAAYIESIYGNKGVSINKLTREGIIQKAQELINPEDADQFFSPKQREDMAGLYTPVFANILRDENKIQRRLNDQKIFSDEIYTLDPNGGEQGHMLKFMSHDSKTDSMHYVIINLNTGSIMVHIDYNYTTLGQEHTMETKARTVKLSEFFKIMKESFYYKNKDEPGYVKNIGQSNITTYDGKDTSYEALKRLENFIKSTPLFNTAYENITPDIINNAVSGTISTKAMTYDAFVYEDITKAIKHRMHNLLNNIDVRKNTTEFIDEVAFIRNMHLLELKKYKNLVPGMIFNGVSDKFGDSYHVLQTDLGLEINGGIDNTRVSENSILRTESLINKITMDPLYMQNTALLRLMLSQSKIYTNYTALKIINELYTLGLNDVDGVNFNIQKHIQTLIDNTEDVQRKQVLTELLSYKDEKGEQINMFTPNAVSKENEWKYEHGVYKPQGVNLKAGYINLPEAFEDELLMDYDDAQAIGYNEADKTWMGQLYGFKGAVKLVKGLRKKFGVSILTQHASLISRNSGGALLEMMSNLLRDYLLSDGKTFTGVLTQNKYDEIKKHQNKIDEYINKGIITLRKGKLVLDSKHDYYKIFDDIFGTRALESSDFDSKKGIPAIPKDIQQDFFPKWLDLLIDTLEDGTYTYRKKTNLNTEELVTLKLKKLQIVRGELYISLDSDRAASKTASVGEDELIGGVTYSKTSESGAVRSGVTTSYSSMIFTEAKGGGVNFRGAFDKDESIYAMHSQIVNRGIESLIVDSPHIIKDASTGLINIDASVKAIKEATKVQDKFLKYIIDYLLVLNDEES